MTSKGLRSETTLMPWLIWILAALFYAYEFLQRVSISIYLPNLIRDFHTDAAAISIMSATYYYAYALMQIPAGALIDWLGPKRLTVIAVLLVSLGSFYLASIHTVYAGAIARFILGLGSAFAFVATIQFIIIWFPASRFALLAGLTNLAGYVGATMGEVPFTYFVHHFGWRQTVIGSAILGLILTIAIFLFVKDKPYGLHKIKSRQGRIPIPHIFKGLVIVLKNWKNWINGLYAGLMMGPTSAFAALWGVSFLIHIDKIQPDIAAGAVSFIFIGVAIGSPVFGAWSDWIKRRQSLLIFAAAGALIATSLLIFLNSIPLYVIYALCFLFGFFQSAHVLNFAIAKEDNPRNNSGTAIGFINMLTLLGGGALQPIIGFLLDWEQHGKTVLGVATYSRVQYHSAFLAIIISQVVALLIAIFFLQDKRKEEDRGGS